MTCAAQQKQQHAMAVRSVRWGNTPRHMASPPLRWLLPLLALLLILAAPITPAQAAGDGFSPAVRQVDTTVHKGDSFSQVLRRHGVGYDITLALASAARPVHDLARRLQPGQTLTLGFGPHNQLVALATPLDDNQTLLLRQAEGGSRFTAQLIRAAHNSSATASPRLPAVATFHIPDLLRGKLDDPTRAVAEKVQKGDTLAKLLGRQHIGTAETLAIARASRPVFPLARRLKVGESMRLAFDEEGKLEGLTYPVGDDHLFWLVRDAEGNYIPTVEEKVYQRRLATATGVLNHSLFEATQAAGISHDLANRLAGLFEWDVDFARDIRAGDSFRIIFEELYYQGEKVRDGDILAAEFISRGTVFKALHYTDTSGNSGYYDPDGQSVRKMFIRAPVDFTRVSSRFSTRRLHPVYGYTRAHKGVDYAAPSGTPVRAAGDGTVTFVGRQGGFGRLILVRHNHRYTTAYAHLSRFGRGLRKGQRVEQGEVIGYVGSSGVATGPHLHYEVREFGQAVNPLDIKAPSADPVPATELARFRQESQRLMAQLGNVETAVASLPGNPTSKNQP